MSQPTSQPYEPDLEGDPPSISAGIPETPEATPAATPEQTGTGGSSQPYEAGVEGEAPSTPAVTPADQGLETPGAEEPKPTEEPAQPTEEPAQPAAEETPADDGAEFLPDMSFEEIQQLLNGAADVAEQVLGERTLDRPLDASQRSFVDQLALEMGEAPVAAPEPAPATETPTAAPQGGQGLPGHPPSAPPDAASQIRGASDEVLRIIRAQDERIKTLEEQREIDARRAAHYKEQQKAERVKRQRAEFDAQALAQGVPNDLLEDAWSNAVRLKTGDDKLKHANLGTILNALKTSKPGFFGTPPAPEPAPAAAPKAEEPVKVRPRQQPKGETGSRAPRKAKVEKRPSQPAGTLEEAADRLRRRGRGLL